MWHTSRILASESFTGSTEERTRWAMGDGDSGEFGTSPHFSPAAGEGTRKVRHYFVALTCRARRTVKYACARQVSRVSYWRTFRALSLDAW